MSIFLGSPFMAAYSKTHMNLSSPTSAEKGNNEGTYEGTQEKLDLYLQHHEYKASRLKEMVWIRAC